MKCECKKCGYKWESRVDNPKSCPECKARTGLKKAKKGAKP